LRLSFFFGRNSRSDRVFREDGLFLDCLGAPVAKSQATDFRWKGLLMDKVSWTQLPRIALIDPDLQSYQAVQAALADRFRFISATTSEAALRLASGLPIWLWSIAAHLPDISGAEFCRILRNRDPNSRIVVVGEASVPDDEVACRIAGVPYFFCKPLDPSVFAELVDQLGQGRQAERSPARRNKYRSLPSFTAGARS
jgi:PleD family two-component response regulator